MKETLKDVIIFLDTDKHVSPFDQLIISDNFPNVQIFNYSQVEPSEAATLIQDAMFPRGPKGAVHTKIFIGGYDIEKAEGILKIAKATMFPPFELAIIVDPRGANTTASSMVAKVFENLSKIKFGGFIGKKVTILGGTGPVGQVCAKIMSQEGADVTITSRHIEKANATTEKLSVESKADRIRGVQVSSLEEAAKAVRDAEIVLATGSAGVQLLPLSILKEQAKQCKVVADVNAVAPYGIEGLNPNDDGAEFSTGILGVGALAIGSLKNEVEVKLIGKALESQKGIFDFKVAYEIAKSLIKWPDSLVL